MEELEKPKNSIYITNDNIPNVTQDAGQHIRYRQPDTDNAIDHVPLMDKRPRE